MSYIPVTRQHRMWIPVVRRKGDHCPSECSLSEAPRFDTLTEVIDYLKATPCKSCHLEVDEGWLAGVSEAEYLMEQVG